MCRAVCKPYSGSVSNVEYGHRRGGRRYMFDAVWWKFEGPEVSNPNACILSVLQYHRNGRYVVRLVLDEGLKEEYNLVWLTNIIFRTRAEQYEAVDGEVCFLSDCALMLSVHCLLFLTFLPTCQSINDLCTTPRVACFRFAVHFLFEIDFTWCEMQIFEIPKLFDLFVNYVSDLYLFIPSSNSAYSIFHHITNAHILFPNQRLLMSF